MKRTEEPDYSGETASEVTVAVESTLGNQFPSREAYCTHVAKS